MAHNISTRQQGRRQPRKNINQDFIYENPKATNSKKGGQQPCFPCQGCDNIFRDKKIWMHHQAQCLTVKVDLTKQSSFFGSHLTTHKQQPASGEKILPFSQPLKSYAEIASLSLSGNAACETLDNVNDESDIGIEIPDETFPEITFFDENNTPTITVEEKLKANLPDYIPIGRVILITAWLQHKN